MGKPTNHTEAELNGHRKALVSWIADVKKLDVPTSHSGVVNRFIRDCELLITEISADVAFTAMDLVDFTDRRESLHILYNNIKSDAA